MAWGADYGRVVLPLWVSQEPAEGHHAFSIATECVAFPVQAPGNRPEYFGLAINAGRVLWEAEDFGKFGADALSCDAFLARRKREDQLSLLDDWNAEKNTADKQLVKPLKFGETVNYLNGLPVPVGVDGLVVRGAKFGTIDNNVFIPQMPGLVAHHNPDKPPQYSTRVYDIAVDELSPTAWAGLHSMMWVKQLPAPSPCDAGMNTKDYALAWNCTASGGNEGDFRAAFNPSDYSMTGFGLAAFKARGTVTTGFTPHIQPTTGGTAGGLVNDPDAPKPDVGSFSFVGRSIAPPPPDITPQTVIGVNAFMAQERSGPLCAGHPMNDKHLFGANELGERFNAGHLHIDSYFTDEGELFDAPLDFEKGFHPPTVEGLYPYQVHLMYDVAASHPFKCGARAGRWRWHVKLPLIYIKPPENPGLDVDPVFKFETSEHYMPSLDWVPQPIPIDPEIKPRPTTGEGHDFMVSDTGSPFDDWKKSPRVAHFFATGKRLSSTGNADGRFPFDYTNLPYGDLGNNVNPWGTGTADGVTWVAAPELATYRVRNIDTVTATLSQASLGMWGATIFGFGKASDDWGSIVNGFTFQQSGSTLNVQGVDAAGASDATKTIAFLTPVTFSGTVCFPAGTVGAPSIASCADPDTGFYFAGANTLLASLGGVNKLTMMGDRIAAGPVLTPTGQFVAGDGAVGTGGFALIGDGSYNTGLFSTSSELLATLYVGGTSALSMTNLGSCTVGFNLTVTNNATITGNATVNGNTTLGNATSDTITFTARMVSDLIPSTNNARDLGTSALGFRDVFSDQFDCMSNGSASLPALKRSTDTNTGVYFPAADQLGIAAGGRGSIFALTSLTFPNNAAYTVTVADAAATGIQLTVRAGSGDSGAGGILLCQGGTNVDQGDGGEARFYGGDAASTLGGQVGGKWSGRGGNAAGLAAAAGGDAELDGGAGATGGAAGTVKLATIRGGLTLGRAGLTSTLDGVFLFDDGSAGAPSIANQGDADTGFYWSDADELSAATGGIQRMVINSAGKVTATAAFQVDGASTFLGNAQFDANVTLGNATSDTITATGRFASLIAPSADATYDIGVDGTAAWGHLYCAGLLSSEYKNATAIRFGLGTTADSAAYIMQERPNNGQTVGAVNQNDSLVTMTADSVVQITIQIAGVTTDGLSGLGYVLMATFKKDGAAAPVQVGATTTSHSVEDAALAAAVAAFVVSGNAIQIQVTGVAALTINWTWTARINQTK